MNDEWLIYRNSELPSVTAVGDTDWSVPAPPWRIFGELPAEPDRVAVDPDGDFPAGFYYLANETVVNTVNAALRLRRPLLVTGAPGTGKTTLADSIAYELRLGPVLRWLVTSKSTLRQGLYDYDVLGRVHDMNLADQAQKRPREASATQDAGDVASLVRDAWDIGRYVTLGPLGDALLPRKRPRVLLIDEIDKCDIDLPGDLLHVFEHGSYEIPELVRDHREKVTVRRTDGGEVAISGGKVRCHQFPVIVLTSNDERDFPPAFRRRCLQLHLDPPGRDNLATIAEKKLDGELGPAGRLLIDRFVDDRDRVGKVLATDQLLNALHLLRGLTEGDFDKLRGIVLQSLSESVGE